MLRDQRFYLRRLEAVVLLVVVRNFRKPFPPEHPCKEGMALRQLKCGFYATLLDFNGVFASALKCPGLGCGSRAVVVTYLDEEKLLSLLFREFLQLDRLLIPR